MGRNNDLPGYAARLLQDTGLCLPLACLHCDRRVLGGGNQVIPKGLSRASQGDTYIGSRGAMLSKSARRFLDLLYDKAREIVI